MSAAKSQAARMLESLSDGRRWSTVELENVAGVGRRANSRAADLRRLGYDVVCQHENPPDRGNRIYFYALRAVPEEPSSIEEHLRAVESEAVARLDAMRREQRENQPASTVSLGTPPPEQAEDAGTEGVPAPSPAPAAGAPSSPAAGAPSFRQQWLDDLEHELHELDGEVAALRSLERLTTEDAKQLDELLERSRELGSMRDSLTPDLERSAA